MNRSSFKNTSGKSVYYLQWEVDSPKAIVVSSHGMIEHPERYDDLAK